MVSELLDNPASAAVFRRRFGKLMGSPLVSAARSLSLAQLMDFAKVYLPASVIAQTLEELEGL